MIVIWIIGSDVIELERFIIRKNQTGKCAVGF